MAKKAAAAKTSDLEVETPKPKASAKKDAVAPAAKKAPDVKKTTDAKTPPATKKSGEVKKTPDKAPELLTLTDIGDHLASTFDMPKSHAKIYLAEAVALIGKTLRKGNKVRISGLGVFQVKKRAARKGRNPTTGEAIKIKATKRVGFSVARDLKAKL